MTARTIDIGGDLTVNRLGFGAGRVTGAGYWGPPTDTSAAKQVLRRAVDRGVTLIDTADNYGPNVSEELIASALYPYPDGVVITTKGGVIRTGPDQWHHAGRPTDIRLACEASLRRLKLDCIPLYQLHRIDPAVPVDDQIGTLVELQSEGKIRHIGLDTVSRKELTQVLKMCNVASVQNHFNVHRREDVDVLHICEEQGIAFLPYLPLSGGSLTIAGNDVLSRVARNHNATPGQVALAWLLHHSSATLPTPGTASLAHLEENLDAATIELTDSEMVLLDALDDRS